MQNPNPPSPRMTFQWQYFELAPETDPPGILNVGCSDDPMGFGDTVHHYDLDDWSARFKYFTQGNAAELPFPDRGYHTVILGDILEHCLLPEKVLSEACRVANVRVAITIFEEWTLPGPGQWVKEGAASGDEASRKLGYKDREDYQVKLFPDRIGVDDDDEPHLVHINQFTDGAVRLLIAEVCKKWNYHPLEYYKALEQWQDDHPFFNWLICLERLKT